LDLELKLIKDESNLNEIHKQLLECAKEEIENENKEKL
jgi:hypothetical protein